jgi:hypothetical protein
MTTRHTLRRTLALLAFATLAIGLTTGCASAPEASPTVAAVSTDDGSVFDVQASDGRAAGAMLRATARAAFWADGPNDFFIILMIGGVLTLMVLIIPVPTA